MNRFVFHSVVVVIMCIGLSCNAPRNNPLDTQNPNNKLSRIDGTVQTATNPTSPISSAMVFWKNSNLYVRTNTNGKFVLENLDANNGWLCFSKDGFSSDSQFIEWNGKKKWETVVNLNTLPRLDSILLYSIVKNKNSGRADYQLVVNATVTDDKDIDSVYLSNDELQIHQPLLKQSSAYFHGTFSDFELNLPSFEIIIGRTFNILAREISGNYVNIGGATVKRIIKIGRAHV